MPVEVRLSTTLRRFIPGYDAAAGMSMPLQGNETAGELAQRLGLPLQEISIIMVNRVHASLEQPLQDGDRVAYFPAVGGG